MIACVTGDGGGGDGSSGSEETGNNGGVSTVPVPVNHAMTTYDAMRGLGIVGSSPLSEEEVVDFTGLPEHGRNNLPRFSKVGFSVVKILNLISSLIQ